MYSRKSLRSSGKVFQLLEIDGIAADAMYSRKSLRSSGKFFQLLEIDGIAAEAKL
jgi:hypothetical protein